MWALNWALQITSSEILIGRQTHCFLRKFLMHWTPKKRCLFWPVMTRFWTVKCVYLAIQHNDNWFTDWCRFSACVVIWSGTESLQTICCTWMVQHTAKPSSLEVLSRKTSFGGLNQRAELPQVRSPRRTAVIHGGCPNEWQYINELVDDLTHHVYRYAFVYIMCSGMTCVIWLRSE